MGEGNGTPLQYSCLENPMDRGAWWATVLEVAKSRTQLSNSTHTHVCVSTLKNYVNGAFILKLNYGLFFLVLFLALYCLSDKDMKK